MESIIEVSYAGGNMLMKLAVENSGKTRLTFHAMREDPGGDMAMCQYNYELPFDSPLEALLVVAKNLKWIKSAS